jgi:hypothetical protein
VALIFARNNNFKLEEEKHRFSSRVSFFLLSEQLTGSTSNSIKKKKTTMCVESFVFFFQPWVLVHVWAGVEEEGMCFARFFFF